MTCISMSVKDACCHIGIGKTKFYELRRAKQVQTLKLGRRTLVLTASLNRLIEQGVM